MSDFEFDGRGDGSQSIPLPKYLVPFDFKGLNYTELSVKKDEVIFTVQRENSCRLNLPCRCRLFILSLILLASIQVG